jgi:ligand-binding sensor domain-containing protein
MKFLLILFVFLFNLVILNARDTVVVEILNFSTPIISIIDDHQGNVFIHTMKMVYKFEDNQWKFHRNCTSEDREMIFENGEVSFIDHSKPEANEKLTTYLVRLQKNKVWLPFLKSTDLEEHIFVAKDKYRNIWISAGSSLYRLNINDDYTVLHKNRSIRGIDTLNGKLLVNTYDGIFLDNQRIFPNITYSHGNYLKISNTTGIIIGDKILNIKKDKINFEYGIPEKYYGISLSKSIVYQGKIWVGSNRGIFELVDKKMIHSHLDIVIHNLEILDDKLIASTKKGLYFLKDKKWKPLDNFPLVPFNSIKKIDNQYYGMSEDGLYVSSSFYGKPKLKWNKEMDCYEIIRDNKNNLWLSTSNGIFLFNHKMNSFKYLFKNIEFNKRSAFYNAPYLYFGSTNGLYKIKSDAFNDLKNELQTEISFFLNICLIISIAYLIFLLIRQFKIK